MGALCQVDKWERYVRLLASVTGDLPQAAYTALSKSWQNEWAFYRKSRPTVVTCFALSRLLFLPFLYLLYLDMTSPLGSFLFSLPVLFGGLNIRDPTINAKALNYASRCATQVLIDAIKGDRWFCLADHDNLVTSVRHEWIKAQQILHNRIFSNTFESSDAVS